MLLAVLDTNVLVSGLCRYPGSATFEIVRTMGRFWQLAVTAQIFHEYEDVLRRPRIRKVTGLRPQEVDAVLDYIAQVGQETTTYYYWRPNLPDESDNKFVECAVSSCADYIVTGNRAHFVRSELLRSGLRLSPPRSFSRFLRDRGG